MTIYTSIPYKGGPSPRGIHVKSAKLTPQCGQPIFVGAKGDIVGIYLDDAPDVPGAGCALWKNDDHWANEVVPWQELYIDLRTREGLFACAEWLGYPGIHDLLLGSQRARAGALAHALYLRKVNGAFTPETPLVLTEKDKARGTDIDSLIDAGALYDTGEAIVGILSTRPL